MENPKQFCLGIDLIARRVDKANKKKEKRDLSNVHFIKAELGEFLEVLPTTITLEAVVFLFQTSAKSKTSQEAHDTKCFSLNNLQAA